MEDSAKQSEHDNEGDASSFPILEDLVLGLIALVPFGMIRLVWFLNIDDPVIIGGFVILMFAIMLAGVHLSKKLFQRLEEREA